MSWLRRKWRSVSFRAGLGASLVVGVVTTLGLLLLSLVVFASFLFAGFVLQSGMMERLSGQLEAGVEPEDLVVDDISTDLFLSEGFWMVMVDGEILRSGGTIDQAVFAAPYTDEEPAGRGPDVEFEAAYDVTGVKVVDGRQWLVVEDIVSHNGTQYLVVTASFGDFTASRFVYEVLPFLIPVVAIVMLIAGLITSWFTRRALGSVEKIRVEVDEITQESLDRRVPLTGSGDRIDKLATTMNAMLERLEAATDQQNQFLADASHELRSPVAGLLAQLDIAAAYPDRADTAVLLPKLHSETQRLQLVVDDLLFLSRAAASNDGDLPAPTSIDLDRLLSAEVEHQRLVNESIEISHHGSTAGAVVGNERDLARAIRNLTDNAMRHATSRVTLGISDGAEGVTITVSDDGEGIAPEDAERIFDRFVRLDESRVRDAGGSGLGLAIVAEIVRAHGGSVAVTETPEPGATFAIELPVTVGV